MKGFFVTALTLVSTVAAIPAATLPKDARDTDPLRILPSFWEFQIANFHGPGCPQDPTSQLFDTRVTYGTNTVDGSEIYYWFFAYPSIQAKIGPGVDESDSSTWCYTELKYTEVENYQTYKPTADYRLKLHKNGTAIQASYQLDEGVTAKWKFTYYPEDEDEVVDEITLDGPIVNGQVDGSSATLLSNSPVSKNSPRWSLPECGTGTIRFKTELTVTSKTPEGKGTVTSELVTDKQSGDTGRYGVQQGVSYDFEHCQN